MTEKNAITKNIILTVSLFLVVQTALFASVVFVFRVYSPISPIFYGIMVLFHMALAVFLVRMKKYFLLLETGRHLESINLANLLTITRLSLLPFICYLLFLTQEYDVVPLLLTVTIVAFLTDFLDGTLSRKTHQTTEIGKYLDSISDYSVLLVISIAFFLFRLLPEWFFILIMFRLLFQALAVAVLLIGYGIKAEATMMGKVAVFTTMTLYALEILKLLDIPVLSNELLLRIAEYGVAVVVFISIFDKLFFLIKRIQEKRHQKNTQET